jgi:hypothetical protein
MHLQDVTTPLSMTGEVMHGLAAVESRFEELMLSAVLGEDTVIPLADAMRAIGIQSNDTAYRAEARKEITLVRMTSRHVGIRLGEVRRWVKTREGRGRRT